MKDLKKKIFVLKQQLENQKADYAKSTHKLTREIEALKAHGKDSNSNSRRFPYSSLSSAYASDARKPSPEYRKTLASRSSRPGSSSERQSSSASTSTHRQHQHHPNTTTGNSISNGGWRAGGISTRAATSTSRSRSPTLSNGGSGSGAPLPPSFSSSLGRGRFDPTAYQEKLQEK